MANTDAGPQAETRPSRPIFAIFEGGGAKGVAHVGALEAIKANGLEIIGVAGTSAGALAAVLVAIGLEASDVMDADDPTKHILAPRAPVDILGRAEWRRLKAMRGFWWAPSGAFLLAGIFGAAITSPCNVDTIALMVRRFGLFSTDAIQMFINQVIRNRLAYIKAVAGLERPIPERITFAELRNWPTVVPLKIVATDVDQGTLELFDADNTPDVVVAEAVAASISIPIAFRPARIPSYRDGRFADGGMVSNLPIWVFAEDKLAYARANYRDPPVPTVGFTLDKPDKEPSRLPAWLHWAVNGLGGALFDYAGKLLHATLQGSQGTARRFVEDVTVIRLKTALDTMDFDKSWDDYDAARRAGRDQAESHLRFLLEAKPDRIRTELAQIRADAFALINQLRQAKGQPDVKQLRVNLMEPVGHHSLRIVASVGMEQDADDRLFLDRRGRGAAEAFRRSDLLVIRLGRKFERRQAEFMTKYERALVRRSVKTVICVPIFKDPTDWGRVRGNRDIPHGILALDSDTDIAAELNDPQIKAMLTGRSNVLYEAVSSEVENG